MMVAEFKDVIIRHQRLSYQVSLAKSVEHSIWSKTLILFSLILNFFYFQRTQLNMFSQVLQLSLFYLVAASPSGRNNGAGNNLDQEDVESKNDGIINNFDQEDVENKTDEDMGHGTWGNLDQEDIEDMGHGTWGKLDQEDIENKTDVLNDNLDQEDIANIPQPKV